VTVKTYTLSVTRLPSTNAKLSALTISSGTLSPVFSALATSYSVTVDNTVTSVEVMPTTEDSTASYSATGGSNLSVGLNTVGVQVTAQDGVTVKTYSIAVTRLPSSNAKLSTLGISTGTLMPVFDSLTTSYTALVDNSVTSVTVTPTVEDATASFVVSGGSNLAVGANTVDVQVTAQDGVTVKTYSIVVNRAPSSNARLSALWISSGTLTPAFDPLTTSYTASVDNSVTSVTVTPTVEDSTASFVVSGGSNLAVAANSIDVQVTAQDGLTVKTYTVSVTRAPSSNANLSALVLSTGSFTPVFDSQKTSYTATVDNTVTSVAVTPTVEDSNASFSVSGGTGLAAGPNTVDVQVTAQDTTTIKHYVITINRLPPPLDLWKQAQFGDRANDPSVAGDLADPAGDGVSNILKYALGLDPHTAASRESLPVQGLEGGLLTLTYTKIKAATDISYNVVWSHDLITWSQVGLTEAVVPGTDTPASQKIKASVPTNGARQQLIRLEVARLPIVP
jgi:hypothetical protein